MKLPVWRRGQDDELDEELQSHLQMAIRDRIARGESPEAARLRAEREFGNVVIVKETVRDMWGWVWLEQIWRDVIFACRALRKAPGFTTVAVLTLVLGIGLNTAMFSVVRAVVLRPLPFPEPDRLVAVQTIDIRRGGRSPSSVSWPDYFDWRARTKTLASVSAYHTVNFTLTGRGPSQHVPGVVVSADFFRTLGREPALGRGFRVDDERPDAHTVVISDEFWRSQFNSSPGVVGQHLTINGRSYNIVGVMPAQFHFPLTFPAPQMWLTLGEDARVEAPGDTPMTAQRGSRFLQVVGRLNADASLPTAQAELETIARALAEEHPNDNVGRIADVVLQIDTIVGRAKRPLYLLLGAVGCVLLIACVNLANLITARGAGRQRELALRAALGASRSRIVRLLLTESTVLATAGAIGGVLLASWTIPVLVTYSPTDLRGLNAVTIDRGVLGFTAAIAMACAMLVGLWPAYRATRTTGGGDLNETRTTAGAPQRRVLKMLVVVETALGVVLLVGAVALVRGLDRLASTNPGFDPTGIVTMRVNLPDSRYSYLKSVAFYEELLSELTRTPGVTTAALVGPLPLSGGRFRLSVDIPGRVGSSASDRPSLDFAFVSPGYFSGMRIPIRRGREFTTADNDGAPRVVVINESFAQQYFAGEDPIGKTIKPGLATTEPDAPLRQIVGVVSDIKQQTLNEGVRPMMFVPFAQGLITTPHLIVRASNPDGMPELVRKAIADKDPELAVYGVKRMDEYLAISMATPRFSTFLLTLFALLGLVLSAIGLYGVLAYGVVQRTHEFGVRFALGARPRDVLTNVIVGSFGLVGLGLAVGIATAVALAGNLTSVLDFVDAPDAAVYVVVVVVFFCVAATAALVPARRASRVDPLATLRAV